MDDKIKQLCIEWLNEKESICSHETHEMCGLGEFLSNVKPEKFKEYYDKYEYKLKELGVLLEDNYDDDGNKIKVWNDDVNYYFQFLKYIKE